MEHHAYALVNFQVSIIVLSLPRLLRRSLELLLPGHFFSLVLILVVSASFLTGSWILPVWGTSYTPHSAILISGDAALIPANGVTGGSGTASDPFIIQGWDINASSSSNGITLVGTTAYVIIQNVLVHQGIRGVVFTDVAQATLQSSTVWGNNSTGILIVNSSWVVLKNDNVTANGRSYSNNPALQGAAGPGIEISHSSNIVLSSNSVTANYGNAIFLNVSLNVALNNNNIAKNGAKGFCVQTTDCAGVVVVDANLTSLTQNTITSNGYLGLYVFPSYNVSLSGNTFRSNEISISSTFNTDPVLESLTISSDNTVDGKPVYYYKDCKGRNIDGVAAAEILVFKCSGILLTNLSLTSSPASGGGIILWGVNAALVIHNTFSGAKGVELVGSKLVSILDNNFTSGTGALLQNSLNVTISANNFEGVNSGIGSEGSVGLLVYHNNFITPTSCCASQNGQVDYQWDNGYPSGGNYYSGYHGIDNCSGPQQNICPNPDGIWDSPSSNQTADRYPLARPFTPPSDSSPPMWPSNATIASSNVSTDGLSISWTPANDDTEVVSYRVFIGATLAAYVPGRFQSYHINGLQPRTAYTFQVEAGDAKQYWSQSSLSMTISTLGSPPSNPPGIPVGSPVFWYIITASIGVAGVAMAIWYRNYYGPRRKPMMQMAVGKLRAA